MGVRFEMLAPEAWTVLANGDATRDLLDVTGSAHPVGMGEEISDTYVN